MRILVVDSNIVYAKKVKDWLIENVKDMQVDIAWNAQVMHKRLSDKKYDLIIADIISTFDSKTVSEELQKVTIPQIIWAVIQNGNALKDILDKKIIHKPSCDAEFTQALAEIVPQ